MGALIRYSWHFEKQKMSDLNHPSERLKNAYLATILSIVVVIGGIGLLYYFS